MLLCACNPLNLSKASQFGSALAGGRPFPVLFGGMLSFFRLQNAQIDDTGQVEKGLPLLKPPGDSCDLGFRQTQGRQWDPRCFIRTLGLPRIVDLRAFEPDFRQDGLQRGGSWKK